MTSAEIEEALNELSTYNHADAKMVIYFHSTMRENLKIQENRSAVMTAWLGFYYGAQYKELSCITSS